MGSLGKLGRRPRMALAVAAVSILLGVAASVAAAEPAELAQFCPNGSAPGQCNIPRGVATDPATGDIYVADQSNHRVQRFSAWGEFIGTWGSKGTGKGEFESPQGVAVDSAGNVYVLDKNNRRVQKFDPAGNFILMFGGKVNATTEGNVCTAAESCQKGTEGTADGFFGALWEGDYIAVGPSDKIYVGDQDRIQVFDTSGIFQESIAVSGGTVQSLAVDDFAVSPSYGDIYVTFAINETHSKENVQKLGSTGTSVGSLEVKNPRALATDPSNGDVYAMNRASIGKGNVLRFNEAGKELESIVANDFYQSTGLATNSPTTCGLKGSDLIASSSRAAQSFVRVYGPAPDPAICPPPPVPPSIDDQFATAVGASSATVKARINPHFWTESTRYFVEYGTGNCSEGACTSKQPTPPGPVLEGVAVNRDLTSAGVLLSGLAPDTAYHFRFVAKSKGGGPTTGEEASFRTLPAPVEPGPDGCPNAALRTGASARLPDCRAYEMVSPVDKNGGDVFTNTLQPYKQADSELAVTDEAGQRMTFSSLRAFAGAEGAPFANQYLATRVAGTGWSTQAISPPRNPTSFYETAGPANRTTYKLFSEDLCSGWLLQDSPVALVPGAPDETGTLYRRDLCGGGYEVSSSVAPPNFSFKALESGYFPEVQGASADGAHTVFRADDALTANACATPGIFQVYETLGGGALRAVSVLPSATSAAGKASCEQSSAGTAQGGPGEMREDSVAGAVSADGERVYWTTGGKAPFPAGSGDQPGAIYLRDNAREGESKHNGTGACTQGTLACSYEVSGLVTVPFVDARFLAGSADGLRTLFSIHTPGGGEEQLYEFEAKEEGGTLKTSATLIAEGLQGFMGASKDARRAYFVSSAPKPGWGGTAGKENLYFYEAGATPRLVGELAALDTFGNIAARTLPTPVSALPQQRTSRVSPDGLHAAFLSTAKLTGFENADAESGEPDAEAFLYDATAAGGKGKLVCASCNASGARPAGRQVESDGAAKLWAAAIIPGWPTQSRGSRALSDDGRRLFFTSFEALVPRDTNGRSDVYEWQAASSKEECLAQPMGGELFLTESSGCLSLISSGQSPEDVEFLDATPEGEDVFFATISSLVPQDPGLVDVYDARVNGGFAPPAEPRPSCEGEACQSPPPAPGDQTPASATYNGPESRPPARKCAKGKVKKHGKCVKKKHHKKQKHHKRAKAKKNGRAGKSGRAGR